jgi:hypothetical protein
MATPSSPRIAQTFCHAPRITEGTWASLKPEPDQVLGTAGQTLAARAELVPLCMRTGPQTFGEQGTVAEQHLVLGKHNQT